VTNVIVGYKFFDILGKKVIIHFARSKDF
jgi:hypothetical protein